MIAGALEISLYANMARLQQDMDQAKRVVGNAMDGIERAAASAKMALGAIASGFVLSAITDRVSGAIDGLAKLSDMAQKTGASVENLSLILKVASSTGFDAGEVDKGLIKLSKGMATVDNDTNKVNQALRALGISATDSAGKMRDPAQVYIDVANKLSKFEDGANKTAIAIDLLGKSGAQQLPFFNDIAEHLGKFSATSTEAAKQAERLSESFGVMKTKSGEAFTTFAIELLPTLERIVNAFEDSSKGANSFSFATRAVSIVMETLIVLGSEVSYVFKETALEINGLYKQLVALSEISFTRIRNQGFAGAFSDFFKISDDMKAQAEAARIEHDKFIQSVLNGRKVISEAAPTKSLDYVSGKEKKDAAEKISDYQKLTQEISRLTAEQQKRLALGRELTPAEKRLADLISDRATGAKNLSEKEFELAKIQLSGLDAVEKQVIANEKLIKVKKELAQIVTNATADNADHIARLELENSLVGKSVLQQQLLRSQFESNLALKKQFAEIDKKTAGLTGVSGALITPKDQVYMLTSQAQDEHAAALSKIADLDNILARDEINYKLKQDIAKATEEAQDAEMARAIGASVLAEEAAEKIKQFGADNAEYAAAALALSRDKEMAEQRGFALLSEQLRARIEMLTAEADAVKEKLGISANQLAYDNANLELNQRLLEIKRDTVEIEKEYVKQKEAAKALDIGAETKARLEAEAKARQAKEAAILADTAIKTKNNDWVNQFESDFHGSMLRMMEFGSSSWGAMMRGWKNALKTNIFDYLYKELAKPYVFKIIASITGIFGANGMATAANAQADKALAGTSTTSWLDIGQSLWSALSGGFDKIGTYVSAGIDKLAAVAYDHGLSSAGSALTGSSQAIGTASSYIGAGMAGVTIGTFIAGDKTILGLNGTTTSAIGSAIGAAIGGPIGAFFGGIAGGVFSAAFGMGPKQYEQSTVRGKFSGDGFKGAMNTHWTQEGGWFRGNKAGDISSPLADEGQKLLNGMVGKSGMAFARLISLAGDAARSINGWNFAIDRALLTEEDMTKLFGDMADSMGKFVLPELEKFRAKGENLADTAVRMGDEFIITDTIFKMMGFTAAKTGIASLGMRDSLIQLMGGIQSASSTMESYYKNFYSEDEQHVNAVRQLGDAFKVLGLVAPKTRAEFRSLAETLVTDTTPAGQTLFAAVMKLNPAFASATQAAEDLAKAAKANLASALKQAIADLQPMSRAMAQAQIKTALLIAKSGGPLPTAESLSGALDAIRRPSEELFATVADYKRDQQLTANDLSDLAYINDTQLSVAQRTLDVITRTQVSVESIENVVTESINPTSQSNSRTDSLINRLIDEISTLRGSSANTALHVRRMADLLTNVTRGGESLLTTPA